MISTSPAATRCDRRRSCKCSSTGCLPRGTGRQPRRRAGGRPHRHPQEAPGAKRDRRQVRVLRPGPERRPFCRASPESGQRFRKFDANRLCQQFQEKCAAVFDAELRATSVSSEGGIGHGKDRYRAARLQPHLEARSDRPQPARHGFLQAVDAADDLGHVSQGRRHLLADQPHHLGAARRRDRRAANCATSSTMPARCASPRRR